MGFLNLFKTQDINAGVDEFRNTIGAILIDVRTVEEYRNGHIEGSINLPLDSIATAPSVVKDKNTPLFVHCLSGGRSSQATDLLKRMDYANVKNIGGISSYRGKVVR